MFQRAFLKWPGGKFRLLHKILPLLPRKGQLIEPFVGSAVVFMNAEYEHYLLSDVNHDLITLYQQLKDQGKAFIDYVEQYFSGAYNNAKDYYRMRDEFNACREPIQRAALFLYLNRHGFNGLCRYNGQGIYNVPFGQYVLPYFPKEELQRCAIKLKRARLVCAGFEQSMDVACSNSVVYADPPYVPLSTTAQFTAYASSPFGEYEQRTLAEKAKQLAKKGSSILVSNHDTPFTREVYTGAKIKSFWVERTISAKVKGRQQVKELLALFDKEHQ